MKRMSLVVMTAIGLAMPAFASAQRQADFSGKWVLNVGLSGRSVESNQPAVSFPTYLLLKQTPGELAFEASSNRQDTIAFVLELGGPEVTKPGPEGMTLKAQAKMEGDKLVINSKRSFPSPIGEITTEFREVFSVAAGLLTVERTENIGGISTAAKAVYNKDTQ